MKKREPTKLLGSFKGLSQNMNFEVAPEGMYFHSPLLSRRVKMREMQGAEDKPDGSLHEVNDQGRIPKATLQIAYFHAPQ